MSTPFWDRVLEELHLTGVSRKELASATGIPYATLVNSISKKIDPNLENSIAIANFLDLSVEFLFNGTDIGLPRDIYQVAKSLETLTEEQRAPLIFMINQQIDYWKKVQITGNAPKQESK